MFPCWLTFIESLSHEAHVLIVEKPVDPKPSLPLRAHAGSLRGHCLALWSACPW